MKKKIIFMIFGIILIISSFYLKRIYDQKIYDELVLQFKDINEIEYGSDIQSLDMIESYEGEIIEINEIDSKKVGKQTLKVILENKNITRIYEKTIQIVDTNKPIILFKEDEIIVKFGQEYDIVSNIEKVYDLVDGNLGYEFSSNVDYNTAGTYTVTIKAIDQNQNETKKSYKITVLEKEKGITPTYINGILLVNKQYALPSTFGDGIDPTAYEALLKLQEDGTSLGYNLELLSGYRSYEYQESVFEYWVSEYGLDYAQNISARPGHSEHQSGLAFDVGSLKSSFGETEAGKWLAAHCAEYGFIIRYPKNKTDITGYYYEPWHIRYVGVEHSIPIMEQGLTLEEYLGVKS